MNKMPKIIWALEYESATGHGEWDDYQPFEPSMATKYIRADIVEDVLRFMPCHCHKEHGDNEACPALKIERLLGGKR